MDKTIEILVVAMIALLVASILLFLVQDRTTSYSDFLGSQQDGAQCELWKSKGQCDKMSEESCSQDLIDECNGEGTTTTSDENGDDDSTTTGDGSAASPYG